MCWLIMIQIKHFSVDLEFKCLVRAMITAITISLVGAAAAQPRRAATLRVAGASEGCRFAAAGPNNVRQY